MAQRKRKAKKEDAGNANGQNLESLTAKEHGMASAEKSGRKRSMSVILSRKTTHHMMVMRVS